MRYLYENFLHPENFKTLSDVICHEGFPWFSRVGAVSPEYDEPAFSNMLCNEYGPRSQEFENITPILHTLDIIGTIRVKANLDLRVKEEKKPVGFHTDIELHADCLWTMVLYLNTCNGGTMFEKDMASVSSQENRAIIFPTSMRHSGYNQTDTTFRYLINLNFLSNKLPDGGKEF